MLSTQRCVDDKRGTANVSDCPAFFTTVSPSGMRRGGARGEVSEAGRRREGIGGRVKGRGKGGHCKRQLPSSLFYNPAAPRCEREVEWWGKGGWKGGWTGGGDGEREGEE